MNTRTSVERAQRPPAQPGIWAGVAYDGGTGAISAARAFAAQFLSRAQSEYGIPVFPEVVADAQLVVSELVTNACKYAPGPCALNLELDGPVLVITVWDTDSGLPIARAAEPGRIGQHGLEIILAVCDGFDVRREPVGKRIKVRLPVGPADFLAV